MNINWKDPKEIIKYGFYWSEVRLLIAALALILGGIPPVMMILPLPITATLLSLAWIISGAVSIYLAYEFYRHGFKVFGGSEKLDLAAFGVMLVSGLNLGIVGISGTNIGMTISSNYIVFVLAALVYIAAAIHLFRRYKSTAGALFS